MSDKKSSSLGYEKEERVPEPMPSVVEEKDDEEYHSISCPCEGAEQLLFYKNDKKATPLDKRSDDAGYDLYSAEDTHVKAGERICIDTGLKISIPSGYYGQIFPRSSYAIIGLDVSGGVIDSSYRGIVKVIMVNNSSMDTIVSVGDKIAQIVLIKVYQGPCEEVYHDTCLGSSARGTGGFGSTGN